MFVIQQVDIGLFSAVALLQKKNIFQQYLGEVCTNGKK